MMRLAAFAIVLAGVLWACFGYAGHMSCDPRSYEIFVSQTLRCVDQMEGRGFSEDAIVNLCKIQMDCPPPPKPSPYWESTR